MIYKNTIGEMEKTNNYKKGFAEIKNLHSVCLKINSETTNKKLVTINC